jgi:hypothetical protein
MDFILFSVICRGKLEIIIFSFHAPVCFKMNNDNIIN